MGFGSTAALGAGSASLGTLVVYIAANATQYERALKIVESSTAATMEKAVQTTKYATAAMAGSLAIVGALGVREFAKLDDAMTKSLAILGKVDDKTRRQMENTARAIARDSVNSADKVAAAYQGLASAGLDAQQSMASLATVEKFAVASQMNMNQSVLTLTDSVGALGLATKDAAQYQRNITRVADVLAQGANISQASVEELAVALQGKVAGNLRMVNKEVEEGVAVLGAFAKAGIKGLDASEKMAQVLRDLQVSALEQPETWKRFGLAVYDSAGNMRHMADIVGDLERVLAGMSTEQKRTSLTMLGFQDRSVSAMVSLLGFSGLIREYESELKKAGGTTQNMAEIQLSSLISQWTIFLNKVKDMLIVIGQELLPVLQVVNKALDDYLKATNNAEVGTASLAKVIKDSLVGAISVTMDVIHGWRIVLVSVELAFTTLGGVIAWFSKSGEVAILALSTVLEKALRGWVVLLDLTTYGLRAGFNQLLIWIREAQISVAESLNKVLPKANQYTEENFFGQLRVEVTRLKGELAGLKKPDLDMTTANGAALEKATEEWKQFFNETDAFSRRNKELSAELWKLIDAGIPSEQFKAKVDAATQKLNAAGNASQMFKYKLDPLPPLLFNLSKAVATVTPELIEFERLTRDPLGNAMIESFKVFDRVLAQGLITVEQYNAAVRDVVSKQNQFVMPVRGMMQQTGDENVDKFVDLHNEEKLLTDSYNRKLKAVQDYYNSLGTLTKQQEATKLAILKEMEDNYLAQETVFQQKRQELIMASAMQIGESLVSIAKDLAGEQSGIYKAMFAASKAFAIADAIIKIQQGIANAAALPFPANLGAMASVAAATASIVSNIQSVALSFEGGGHTGNKPRRGGLDGKGGFMAMLHPREVVIDLHKKRTNDLEALLGSSPARQPIEILNEAAAQQAPTIEVVNRVPKQSVEVFNQLDTRSRAVDAHNRTAGPDSRDVRRLAAVVQAPERSAPPSVVNNYETTTVLQPRERARVDSPQEIEEDRAATTSKLPNVTVNNFTDANVTTQQSADGRSLEIIVRRTEERMASNVRARKGPLVNALEEAGMTRKGR